MKTYGWSLCRAVMLEIVLLNIADDEIEQTMYMMHKKTGKKI